MTDAEKRLAMIDLKGHLREALKLALDGEDNMLTVLIMDAIRRLQQLERGER